MRDVEKHLCVIITVFFIMLAAGSLGRDAWSFAGENIPPPSDVSWIRASIEQKIAISHNDSNRWETRGTSDHDRSDFQMYRFNAMKPNDAINNLTVIWRGYGEERAGYDTFIYIWNNHAVSWEQLDAGHLTADGILKGGKADNISNYADGEGFVYLAAQAQHYNYAPPTPSPAANPGYTDVTISWSPVNDPDGDNVQYNVQIDGIADSGWINATSYYVRGLFEGTEYTYRVRTRDDFEYAQSPFAVDSFITQSDKSCCPFVYGLNGSKFDYITDLEGGVLGAPFFKVGDYRPGLYDLGSLQPDNGTYKIKIRETIAEADFIDEAKLWVVDVPKGYDVYTDWKNVYLSGLPVTYNLYTVRKPRTPKSAYDKFGRDVLRNLEKVDDFPVNETQNDTNYYTLDFGKIKHPEHAKLIVHGWSVFASSSNDSAGFNQNTTIEVINKSGKWQMVKEFGRSSGDLKPTVYDISNIWLTDDLRIRIHPTHSKLVTMVIDRIELDDSVPVPVKVKVLEPSYADLHHGGKDSYLYPDLKHRLHAYDLQQNDSRGAYFYGNFTKYGNVLPLLGKLDDRFVIMRHGDEMTLEFPEGEKRGHGNRKLFLYAGIFYSIKKRSNGDFLRDTIYPLPFHGMSQYPYNNSIENYPDDGEHLSYLEEWNTRICEKGRDCYEVRNENNHSVELYNEIDRMLHDLFNITYKKYSVEKEEKVRRSLNTNYVELKVDGQVTGATISNLSSWNTSKSSYIRWDNDVPCDNRAYYGLNGSDVNDLVNGSWSAWQNDTVNVNIKLSGLLPNTRYYYKPVCLYLGTVNNPVTAGVLVTRKQGLWISPAEYMISPKGWISSPENFRTVNISAAPLDSTGHYISGLSPEAVLYNSTGIEIGRTMLEGNGPYHGNFTLPDYLAENGYVNITGSDLVEEYSVLKWSCANCHYAGGDNYPSTFGPAFVHPFHTDTTQGIAGWPCHGCAPDWVRHPQDNDCGKCHLENGLDCDRCHSDMFTGKSLLSAKYGADAHADRACSDCHGALASLKAAPDCTACHPLYGSNVTVPASIRNLTHSALGVACGLCHDREHDIRSPGKGVKTCRNCHPGITHDSGLECSGCHADPHKIIVEGGTECISCHAPGDVNISLFGRHANINASDGVNVTSNFDCWTCHYLKDMELLNVYLCESCHINASGVVNVTDPSLVISDFWHGNTTCKICHAARTYHVNGTAGPLGTVEKILSKMKIN